MSARKTEISVLDKSNGGTNLTDWIYRGGSFAALLGVVTYLGVNLMNGQSGLVRTVNDMRTEFQMKLSDLRSDSQAQFAIANNGVTVLTGIVGQNTGNLQMLTTHVDRQDMRVNELDQRITRLEALQGARR